MLTQEFISFIWLLNIEFGLEVLVLVFFILLAIWSSVSSYKLFAQKDEPEEGCVAMSTGSQLIFDNSGVQVLVYQGNCLNLPDESIISILEKRFNYYKRLDKKGKEKFLKRLKEFIGDKTFSIHDKAGFREMPVLISACAIQLTFGLEKYLLPWFKQIHIYPAEFLGLYPTIRFLMGNVSGNTIHIGWKYFMEGIDYNNDGKNLGLHEMSHALYYQTFVVEDNVDMDFQRTFDEFTLIGDRVYNKNQEKQEGLYSTYAMRNFQEFWAESVELFFERPLEMKITYPELFASMAELLDQRPI